jgi:hypothetical protein
LLLSTESNNITGSGSGINTINDKTSKIKRCIVIILCNIYLRLYCQLCIISYTLIVINDIRRRGKARQQQNLEVAKVKIHSIYSASKNC